MTTKINKFTTSTTTDKKMKLNPAYDTYDKNNTEAHTDTRIPKSGTMKFTVVIDEDEKKGEDTLGIELQMNYKQIQKLSFLIGQKSLEDEQVYTALKILNEIVKGANFTRKMYKEAGNLIKKYETLSPKEKEKYPSINEYIEENLPNQ